MTTASIGHQGGAKRDARRAKSWRHVTSEEAGPGVTLLGFPRPVSSWRATALAWTGVLFGRTPSVSHHLSSLGRLPLRGWSGRPSSSRSPLFGDRQSAALPDWSFCGAQGNGKTATLVPSRWSFARRLMLDTLADWWGLQRHCGGIGGRGLFAPQLTYPRSSWEQGSHLPYTPTGRLR